MRTTDSIDGERLRRDAESVFRAGVARVDPRPMVRDTLRIEGDRLTVRLPEGPRSWDPERFDRILLLGFGKAAAAMARGATDILGDRIDGGLAVVKSAPPAPVDRIRIVEAAHPVPDVTSVAAARAMRDLARRADERTLALVLVSGGGSSLLCAPWADGPHAITLEDKAAVTRGLLACGAGIGEINTVRKHLSAVKGGRLAAALSPATVLTLILSDVVGDDPAAVASGPTVPDPSTWADARAVVRRHGLETRIPPAVARLLDDGAAGRVPDTPKPGDPVFDRVTNLVIGSNRLAVTAALLRARELGYATQDLGSALTGEARDLAAHLLGRGLDLARREPPAGAPVCLLGGGETTVTLRGGGTGGRNQEMALAFLAGLADADPALARRLCFLSAGTDGNDGPTDAAGAFADLDLLAAAGRASLVPGDALAANDSYRFFDAVGGLLRTGPTGTNVCDLQVLLVR
ncbi:MAG: DUF4147 domain-containing protein [Lentisphaerae bacterium]|nr:DUF4147 domain-containing protein [Lentisphaerota bacterium]